MHIFNKKDNSIDDDDDNNKLQKWTKHLTKILIEKLLDMMKKFENEGRLRSELYGLEFINLQSKNQPFVAVIQPLEEREK